MSSREELLQAARLRVSLPPGELWLDYQEAWTPLHPTKRENTTTRSESDFDDMIVFDFEGEEVVGIEIMDVTGQLKYATRPKLPLILSGYRPELTSPF
jgi:hypothetical protein